MLGPCTTATNTSSTYCGAAYLYEEVLPLQEFGEVQAGCQGGAAVLHLQSQAGRILLQGCRQTAWPHVRGVRSVCGAQARRRRRPSHPGAVP